MDFFAFVDRGFSKRRKTLANALGWDGNRPYYETILSKAGLSPSIRSEDLGIDEWRMVYLASRG
jgi:16S rRNA A1518/A1519 N6-dimethyltransferase RsmA/KsgA/DIM1 with predicted DNA glycosylase/AP lyase activity